MKSVLVVDDETAILNSLATGLRHDGFRVLTAGDGPTAIEVFAQTPTDVVVLDVMLPGMSGIEVCAQLRALGKARILMLSSRDQVSDKILGLHSGADDYLTKPFNYSELLARIHALLRRDEKVANIVELGPLRLDELAMQLQRQGENVELSLREYELIRFLMAHPGQVLSRQRILEAVWGSSFQGSENIVDVYIGYLRAKLDPGHDLLQTVRGAGYRLNG